MQISPGLHASNTWPAPAIFHLYPIV
jgi:hypothetical protein